eukprot:CAMPEP_0115864770 /NCGR_PEP_ID=MMETSP0287-20121206/19372_1 /TAXON_ID=412157 /ORGANISM="Chrysochromulina rotalis, Strain UIO044" /LENGTH=231 /DNA_ID=CAMNT_0003319251 /DNA_START=191 /DNA_END=886 /DNA_ORIENTATION=-
MEADMSVSKAAAALAQASAAQFGAAGRDPRQAPPWITENAKLLDDLKRRSSDTPKAATASSCPAVGSIQSIDDFESALEKVEGTAKIVIIKFYAPWCKLCLRMKPLFDSVASQLVSMNAADFYEVDAACARVLCAFANVELFPAVHIYSSSGSKCDLRDALILETKEDLNQFKQSLATFKARAERMNVAMPPPPPAPPAPPQSTSPLPPPPTQAYHGLPSPHTHTLDTDGV